MAQTAQQFVAQMSSLKARNLAFFKRYFPEIHRSFKDRELTASRLNVDPNNMTVDLLIGDQPLYDGDARAYNHNEAAEFSNAFKPGMMNHPLRHAYPGEFSSGRFFHAALEQYLIEMEAVQGSARPYLFEHSLPQVVFLGCGLGCHIAELLKLRDVRHGIVVEHDPDRFLASLYVTDWEALVTPYIDDQSRSFTFSVGDTLQTDDYNRIQTAFASAWNASCVNVPFMPVQTVYYVHLADAFYTRVSTRLNQEIEPFVNVWGFYDDEVNQLNHVLHNFERKIPILRKFDLGQDTRITLVCGNGPSLDACLPLLREHRDKINLISAGSTTHTLLMNDILPDLVVTIESDLSTYKALQLLPAEKARQIPVIGSAQIHPDTWSLFGDALMFAKSETAYAQVFSGSEERIADGTPSATNSALALALDFNLPNIYLVGMDYGFQEVEKSHASGAFYYDEEHQSQFERFRNRIRKGAYLLEENEHGRIYTTPFYNTCRIHAQRKIRVSRRQDLKNLSQGASIETVEFSPMRELEEHLQAISVGDTHSVFEKMKSNARVQKIGETRSGVRKIHRFLEDVSVQCRKALKELHPDRESIDSTVFKINQIVSSQKARDAGTVYMMLRGTIWHWLFNYYALSKQYDRQDQLYQLTESWKQHFSAFLGKLPDHFQFYIADKSPDDPRLQLTMRDPEPEIENWLKASGESVSK